MCVYKLLMVIKHSKSSRNNDYIKNSDENCDFFPLTYQFLRTSTVLGNYWVRSFSKTVNLDPNVEPRHDDTIPNPLCQQCLMKLGNYWVYASTYICLIPRFYPPSCLPHHSPSCLHSYPPSDLPPCVLLSAIYRSNHPLSCMCVLAQATGSVGVLQQ